VERVGNPLDNGCWPRRRIGGTRSVVARSDRLLSARKCPSWGLAGSRSSCSLAVSPRPATPATAPVPTVKVHLGGVGDWTHRQVSAASRATLVAE
jgi:hypothetical protein